MKKVIFAFLLFCSVGVVSAQHLAHDDIRISLLTADPGEDIYAVFGHSAIRVKIDVLGYDVVFNYGTIDFNQPYFYINFAYGKMWYYLSMSSYERFMSSYMFENRGIREQVFALDSAQTFYMVRFLEKNYLPENRYYFYNFFLDNCATRIRDIIYNVYLDSDIPATFETPCYRELIHRYLRQHPWGRFGIDIALGLPTDQRTNLYEQMFLPDFLFDAFSQTLNSGNPIISETNVLYKADPSNPAQKPPGLITPLIVCSFVLFLALLFMFVQKGAVVFDFILFFSVGLTGLLVVFLWFFTQHVFTANNLNIIWALPTHTAMAFFLFQKRFSHLVGKYFLSTAIIAMLLLFAWVFLPQKLNPSLIPLVVAIALRAYRNSRRVKL